MSSVASNDNSPAISRANSAMSWAEGVADADMSSAPASFIEGIGDDDIAADVTSTGGNSFSRKLKAAVDADKVAAEAQVAAAEAQKAAVEAATIARVRNADLEGCIRKPSLQKEPFHSSGSLSETALQMLENHFSTPSDTAVGSKVHEHVVTFGQNKGKQAASSPPPSSSSSSSSVASHTNRDFNISEILAKAKDDHSVSSISRMDFSLHHHDNYDNQPSLCSLPSPAHVHARSIAPLHLPFPVALHTLLQDNPCPSAVCWNKKGTKVKLHTKHPQFNTVLKRYFGEEGSKFSNLRRKANRWRFKSKCLNKNEGLYCLQNDKFSRDRDPICSEICPTEAEKNEIKKNVQSQGGVVTLFPSTTSFIQNNARSLSAGTIPTLVTATTGGTSDLLNLADALPTFECKKRKVSGQSAKQPQSLRFELRPPQMSDELSDWLSGANI